jgi:integrase
MKLTKSVVEKLMPSSKGAALIWDEELAGFGLRLTHSGVRSYIVQARVNGRTRRETLGRHGVLTAEEARKKARRALGRMADGVDPSAEKKRGRALSVTLKEVTEQYLATRKTKDGLPLKERTKADIEYHLGRAFREWADRPVVEITRDKVSRLHEKLSKDAPKQADQAFRNLRALINFARASHRTPEGAPILIDNPVAVLSEAKLWHGSGQRTGQVPIERVGEWWAALQARRADPELTTAGKTGADLIAFLTLTGLRWAEAAQLTWDAVDLEQGSMRLADPKNRRPVILPLSAVAVAIIAGRPRITDPEAPKAPGYVFAGRGGRSYVYDARPTLRAVRDTLDAKAKENKLDLPTIEVAPHDLRRTFIAVADKLRIERWRIKMLVNHSLRSSPDVMLSNYTEKVDHTGASDRRDLRPEADRIATWIEGEARVTEGANVTAIKRKKAVA